MGQKQGLPPRPGGIESRIGADFGSGIDAHSSRGGPSCRSRWTSLEKERAPHHRIRSHRSVSDASGAPCDAPQACGILHPSTVGMDDSLFFDGWWARLLRSFYKGKYDGFR